MQKEINEIVARDPSSKHKDLDHDPVAQVVINIYYFSWIFKDN